MNEREEFEFRLRMEQEEAQQPEAAAVAEQPAGPKKWEDASLYEKVMDYDWVTHEPVHRGKQPIEPSIAKNFAYPGGVVSTGVVQGAKQLSGGNGSMEDMKAALRGNAKSVPQQLEESGVNPYVAKAIGIPAQIGMDPMAGFSGKPFEAALSPVGQFIKNRLKALSTAAAKIHLRPTPAVKQALGEEGLNAAANEALEQGTIRPGARAAATAERIDAVTDKLGFDKGEMLANSPVRIDPNKIAATAEREVVAPLVANSETKAAGMAMGRKIKGFADHYNSGPSGPGSMTPKQLDAVKQSAQDGVNYLATSPKAVAGQKAQAGWASTLRKGVEEAVPEVAPLNKELHNLYNAQSMAGRTGALQNGQGLMGHVTDVAVGTNALSGDPLSVAAAIARGVTKGRISSTVAAGAHGAAKAVPGASNAVAQAIANRMIHRPQQQLKEDLIDQQTNPEAQEELKRSQE